MSSTVQPVMVGGFVGMQTPKDKLSLSVAGPSLSDEWDFLEQMDIHYVSAS